MKFHHILSLAAMLTVGSNLSANDLGGFGLTKWEGYTQTSTATPAPNVVDGFQMYVNIENGDTGSVLLTTTMTPPAGASGTINLVANGSNTGLFFEQFFSTKAAMDAAFPDGTYNYTINTNTPNTYNLQQTTGADAYPPIPQLTTPGATWTGGNLQVDPTQTYTFTWPGYVSPGGNGSSITITSSSGNVASSSVPGDGTPGSYTLPANTLQAGVSYNAYIQYGNGAFQTQVNFSIQTGTNNPGIYLQKSAQYDQSSTATPTLDPEEPYQVYTDLNPATTGSLLLTSTITLPAGSTGKINLGLGSQGLEFIEDFPSSLALDAAFRNGTYNISINTSIPSTITGQTSFGTDDYPMIPKI